MVEFKQECYHITLWEGLFVKQVVNRNVELIAITHAVPNGRTALAVLGIKPAWI